MVLSIAGVAEPLLSIGLPTGISTMRLGTLAFETETSQQWITYTDISNLNNLTANSLVPKAYVDALS